MRKFISPLLVATLMAGCGGGGGGSTSPATQSGGGAVVAATSSSTADLVSKAESLAQVIVGGGTTDFVVDESAASSLAPTSLTHNALAHTVVVGVGRLAVLVGGETPTSPAGRIGAQDVSRLITSPLGGTVQVDIVGPVLMADFRDFKTPRATLHGNCRLTLVSGKISSGTYKANLNFSGLRVAAQAGTFTLEGRSTLDRTRSTSVNGITLDSIWTTDLKVSDAGGGSRTFQNFVTTSHVTVAAGALTATQTYNGAVILDNVRGNSGTFQISTPTALRYAGSQQAFSVEAGQLLVAGGAGTLRLTVTGSNQLEIAVVKPDGSVTVVRQVTWTSLGGSTATD